MPQRKNFLLKIKPGRRNYQKLIPGLKTKTYRIDLINNKYTIVFYIYSKYSTLEKHQVKRQTNGLMCRNQKNKLFNNKRHL